MKTSIETINGNLYTVVWHEPMDDRKGIWVRTANEDILHAAVYEGAYIIATALPALARKPKPEDARLLHLYAGHGIEVHGKIASLNNFNGNGATFPCRLSVITHALDEDGNTIEIAIGGDDGDV